MPPSAVRRAGACSRLFLRRIDAAPCRHHPHTLTAALGYRNIRTHWRRHLATATFARISGGTCPPCLKGGCRGKAATGGIRKPAPPQGEGTPTSVLCNLIALSLRTAEGGVAIRNPAKRERIATSLNAPRDDNNHFVRCFAVRRKPPHPTVLHPPCTPFHNPPVSPAASHPPLHKEGKTLQLFCTNPRRHLAPLCKGSEAAER